MFSNVSIAMFAVVLLAFEGSLVRRVASQDEAWSMHSVKGELVQSNIDDVVLHPENLVVSTLRPFPVAASINCH